MINQSGRKHSCYPSRFHIKSLGGVSNRFNLLSPYLTQTGDPRPDPNISYNPSRM